MREAIIDVMQSSAEPVKAILIDLGATSDLDVPSADMLAEQHKELHSRNVRFMLTRMITPLRQMLERAGAMEEIRPIAIIAGPTEAVLDYLVANYDDHNIQELVRSGLMMVHSLLQTRISTVPVERQATLATIADNLDEEIKRSIKE